MNFLPIPLLLLPTLIQAFSLDVHTKHWNYTTSNLAPTTSAKCKAAYAAEIKCDGLLINLVSAQEIKRHMESLEPREFSEMCSSTCEASLAAYIENVRDACNEPGDAAIESRGYIRQINGTANVPVETVGLMFQYMFARGCARDEEGENCYLQKSGYLPPDFNCNWTCALVYYWTRYSYYPYSDWTFGDPFEVNYYDLHSNVVVGNNYLMQGTSTSIIEDGWENIKKCGLEGSKESPPFDTGVSKKDKDKNGGKAGSSSTVSPSVEETPTKTGSTSATSTEMRDGTAAATPAETGGSGKVMFVMRYFLAGAAILSGCVTL